MNFWRQVEPECRQLGLVEVRMNDILRRIKR